MPQCSQHHSTCPAVVPVTDHATSPAWSIAQYVQKMSSPRRIFTADGPSSGVTAGVTGPTYLTFISKAIPLRGANAFASPAFQKNDWFAKSEFGLPPWFTLPVTQETWAVSDTLR